MNTRHDFTRQINKRVIEDLHDNTWTEVVHRYPSYYKLCYSNSKIKSSYVFDDGKNLLKLSEYHKKINHFFKKP